MSLNDVDRQQRRLRPSPPLDGDGQDELRALAGAHLTTRLPAPGTAAPAQTLDELSLLLCRASRAVRDATVEWLSAEPLSAATRTRYRRVISWWLWWSNRRRLWPEECSALDADLYDAAMRSARWSENTRAEHITALSSWYGLLYRRELAPHNPFAGLRRPRPLPSHVPLLTHEQLICLLSHAVLHESVRIQAIMFVVISANCDEDGLAMLALQDVVRAGRDRILNMPAAGGSHAVLLPPCPAHILDGYLTVRGSTPGPLFLTRAGAPLKIKDTTEQVRRVARAAGIDHAASLTLELIRHSAEAPHPPRRKPRRATLALPGFPAPVYRSGEILLCRRIATEVARRRVTRNKH